MSPGARPRTLCITGQMTRLGRVPAAKDVYGLYFDPEMSALYSGYYDDPPAGTMWTTDGTSAEFPWQV